MVEPQSEGMERQPVDRRDIVFVAIHWVVYYGMFFLPQAVKEEVLLSKGSPSLFHQYIPFPVSAAAAGPGESAHAFILSEKS